MSGVELGLALVGVVDVCYKYGTSLVKACQAFKKANTQLGEHILRVEACWLRIEIQLQVVRGLAALMSERHYHVQQQVLEVLLTKLRIADSKLAGLTRSSSSTRIHPAAEMASVKGKAWKYALLKDSLVEVISELDAWQAIFDPTWFLLMKIASPEVDSQLEVTKRQQPDEAQSGWFTNIPAARHLRDALRSDGDGASKFSMLLRPDGLVVDSISSIPFSPVRTAQRVNNSQIILLDPVTLTSRPSVSAVLRDIRNFARRLRHADPFRFGLLECKGILKGESEVSVKAKTSHQSCAITEFTFVFRLPTTYSKIQSLRWRLLNWSENEYQSLSDRFVLARQLINAVSYVHVYGFVHKNIRPETILIISDGSSRLGKNAVGDKDINTGAVETAVLVGFDVLRDADGKTCRVGDDDWEKNVYRHPSRQGRTPDTDYEMRHDIYSVGVCLLEIGLWETFVAYDDRDSNMAGASRALPTPANLLLTHLGVEPGEFELDESSSRPLKDPGWVKDHLLWLARGKLRRKMGTRYSRVVETCLTCLDKENVDFGDEEEFQDEDGVAVGVRYIEKVLAKLADISV
ncbi:hypothetical protein EsH8_V_001195 [Colletotrichum jinshuiense]